MEKSTREVIADYKEYAKLIRSVIRALGEGDTMKDIREHGADSGFTGFIYYSETVKFWRNHKKDIVKLLEMEAEGLGYGTIEMVRNFNCLSHAVPSKNGALYNYEIGKREPDYTEEEVGRAIYGQYDSELDIIYNALAWFVLETVAMWFEE